MNFHKEEIDLKKYNEMKNAWWLKIPNELLKDINDRISNLSLFQEIEEMKSTSGSGYDTLFVKETSIESHKIFNILIKEPLKNTSISLN